MLSGFRRNKKYLEEQLINVLKNMNNEKRTKVDIFDLSWVALYKILLNY